MHSINVSIDIDGTLLDNTDPDGRRPNLPILNLIHFFARQTKNVAVHICSSRPIHQQQEIINRLGLEKDISGYHQKGDGWSAHIHFDDMHACDIGSFNLIVRMK